mmetsp:Transcript_17193/g.60394  ORF Transcript_17193/g.60394 Transcript_17193/m.60394 type:complete len:465 (+) Transcript_17193:1303-2697(+)
MPAPPIAIHRRKSGNSGPSSESESLSLSLSSAALDSFFFFFLGGGPPGCRAITGSTRPTVFRSSTTASTTWPSLPASTPPPAPSAASSTFHPDSLASPMSALEMPSTCDDATMRTVPCSMSTNMVATTPTSPQSPAPSGAVGAVPGILAITGHDQTSPSASYSSVLGRVTNALALAQKPLPLTTASPCLCSSPPAPPRAAPSPPAPPPSPTPPAPPAAPPSPAPPLAGDDDGPDTDARPPRTLPRLPRRGKSGTSGSGEGARTGSGSGMPNTRRPSFESLRTHRRTRTRLFLLSYSTPVTSPAAISVPAAARCTTGPRWSSIAGKSRAYIQPSSSAMPAAPRRQSSTKGPSPSHMWCAAKYWASGFSRLSDGGRSTFSPSSDMKCHSLPENSSRPAAFHSPVPRRLPYHRWFCSTTSGRCAYKSPSVGWPSTPPGASRRRKRTVLDRSAASTRNRHSTVSDLEM